MARGFRHTAHSARHFEVSGRRVDPQCFHHRHVGIILSRSNTVGITIYNVLTMSDSMQWMEYVDMGSDARTSVQRWRRSGSARPSGVWLVVLLSSLQHQAGCR